MLSQSYPTGLLPGGLPLEDTRSIVAGEVARSATGIPRVGVLPGSPAVIVTGSTQGMQYQIAQFAAVTSRDGIAAEKIVNRAVATVATTAAPSANSRLDVIWVRSRFTSHGDPEGTPVFGVTQGTAAPIPQRPTIPAGALALATAQVTAQDTTTSTVVITQVFPWTAMAGGVVPLRSQVEEDAWAAPEGAAAVRLDTGALLVRAGGVWENRSQARVATYSYLVNGLPNTSNPYTQGAIALVPAQTTDAFATIGTGSSLNVPAGMYDISFAVTSTHAATGRTFVQIAMGSTVLARASCPPGEDTLAVVGKRFLPNPGTLTFGVFKTTSGISNHSGQIVIERVG